MSEIQKLSIRFYNDHEVRAVWNEEHEEWFFAVVDIVAAITESEAPRKYWSVLKTRLKHQENELATNCSQLKLMAADGKKYNTDCIAMSKIAELAKVIPGKSSVAFLDWLTYSDNTIDGQSRKKAYTLFESNVLDTIPVGTVKGLQQIHAYLFGGLYDFAGKIRERTIWKDGTLFCRVEFLKYNLEQVEQMPHNSFDEIVSKYVEMNVCHPFMEGNGRSTRIWLDLMFKSSLGKCVDWSMIDKKDYLNAMRKSMTNDADIRRLLAGALTDDIHSREMFMKGIDYSYYYEQED